MNEDLLEEFEATTHLFELSPYDADLDRKLANPVSSMARITTTRAGLRLHRLRTQLHAVALLLEIVDGPPS